MCEGLIEFDMCLGSACVSLLHNRREKVGVKRKTRTSKMYKTCIVSNTSNVCHSQRTDLGVAL